MTLETRAQRAFWAICALLTALLFAAPGATQAPDDSNDPDTSLADAPVDGDDDAEESEDEGEADDENPVGGVDRGMLDGSRLDPDIENIIVEGIQTEGLADVPIAVTQFSATDIANLRIQNVADLAAYTPNLEINTAFAASNPTLFIRGIGLKDYNSNSAGAVSIWHDEVQMNSPAAQLFSLFDISSIEVLRGPQGSDRGRNATAGSIRLHSAEPDGEWDSWGSFTYGNYNDLEFEGAIGFPIFPDVFDDTLSGRVAFSAGFRDGYLTNQCADWDPEEHGFPLVSVDRTLEIYNELDPSPVAIPLLGGGSGEAPKFVYFNVDLYSELLAQGVVPNTSLRRYEDPDNPGEELFAYIQNKTFQVSTDEVCVLAPPGNVVTPNGAIDAGSPPAGTFVASRPAALTAEDFQGLSHKLNNIKYWAGRGMLRYQPNDSLDFLFIAHWGQNRGDSFHLQSVGAKNFEAPIDPETNMPELVIKEPLGFYNNDTGPGYDERNLGPEFEDVSIKEGLSLGRSDDLKNLPGTAGSDPFNGFYNRDGLEKLDILGFSLRGTWELENGRFVSISAYEENQRFVEDDGDDCPCQGLGADYVDESWQVTQELRLEGEGEDYTWLFSGFTIYEKLKTQNLFFNTITFQLDQNFTQELAAWNLVAQGHYDFLDEGAHPGFYQLSIEGGARYNWEHKIFQLDTVARQVEGEGRNTLEPQIERKTWRELTGDATLSYKPVELATFYAKYTHGLKAGHFNAGLTVNANRSGPEQKLSPVQPEYIDAAEIGLKTTFFDDRVQLSAAAFRYWYTDLQVFDIVNEVGSIPTQQLLNSDAKVIGFEAELKLRPIEGLTLEGGFGWLDTEFIDFSVQKQTSPGDKNSAGAVTTFIYDGNPLIAAPEFNFSGVAEYEIATRWGSLIPRYDFSYKSRTYQDPTKQLLLSQPSFWLHNARLAYRTPDGKLEIAGWVQNFLETIYKVDVFDFTRQFDSVQEIYGEPRTYGFTVSYLW
jgi:outer membrane receptor protein involved in Fe transport